MKTTLISLLLLVVATSTKAENIQYYGESAPIFGNLQLSNITRNMTLINPRANSIINGNITFTNKNLTLTLNKRRPPCPINAMCIEVMPAPLNIELKVISIKNTSCSVVYTAVTPANIKSTISEVVTVEDYTYSKCNFYTEPKNTVSYSVTGISSLSKKQETATANFVVDGPFIRAQN